LIDEAQFLSPEQVRQLHRLAHAHKLPVICWGLRSDFRGEAFAGAATLLTLADDIEEMKTICACARKATMNIRVDAEGRRVKQGEQVVIGGNERYRAVCPACFYADEDAGAAAPGLFG
jgi:thymidine kinase